MTRPRSISALRRCTRRLLGLVPRLPRLLGLALLYALPAQTHAQANSADEYAIRAAMLLNLTKFIDWPSAKLDATHPQFLVCILGQDPISPFADRFLQSQSVGAKPVRVEHLSGLESASSCHILYVGVSERKSLAAAFPELVKNNVLILSERSNASNPNQIVGLPSVDEHVHIEVDLGAAQKSGLVFSSKLLRLATVSH